VVSSPCARLLGQTHNGFSRELLCSILYTTFREFQSNAKFAEFPFYELR
jgi:hypothetical protein